MMMPGSSSIKASHHSTQDRQRKVAFFAQKEQTEQDAIQSSPSPTQAGAVSAAAATAGIPFAEMPPTFSSLDTVKPYAATSSQGNFLAHPSPAPDWPVAQKPSAEADLYSAPAHESRGFIYELGGSEAAWGQ